MKWWKWVTRSSPAQRSLPRPSHVKHVTGAPIWLLPFRGKIPVEMFITWTMPRLLPAYKSSSIWWKQQKNNYYFMRCLELFVKILPTTTRLLFDGRKVQQFKGELAGSRKILRHFPDWASHNRSDASREQLRSHSFPSDHRTSQMNRFTIQAGVHLTGTYPVLH